MYLPKSIVLFSALLLSGMLLGHSWSKGHEESERAEREIQESQSNQEADSSAASQEPSTFVGIERVYSNLRFNRPVYLTGAGDDSGRMFVVEQDGVIHVIPAVDASSTTEDATEDPTAAIKNSTVFLDIREQVNRRGNEEGLLGIAFHPDFANNGHFYVHYSKKTDGVVQGEDGRRRRKVAPNVVSRFTVSKENPNRADHDSEHFVMSLDQPFTNHNGGMIEFGPDGYLYVTFGDGGSANDPLGNGQNMATMLGSIIRIDVDNPGEDKNYSIPEDNPFIGVEGAAEELWAIGLRNVWRFSFDRTEGTLIAADVGQNKIEEVNIIEKGGNYGWNRFEANEKFNEETELVHGEHVQPVAIYERSWGISITGGYVYRGNDYPELQGMYFYGDYASGNLWAMKKDAEGVYQDELVRRTGRSIASFGEDDRGEVYLLSFDGGIYRIVPTDQPEDTFASWPKNLSETGLYADMKTKELADDLIPYSVNAPFWSDGADKGRYIKLPEGEKMVYAESGSWQVPVGAVLVKNFHGEHGRGKTQFETRLIKRTPEGWESATYVWPLGGDDARLAPEGSQFETYQRGDRQWNVASWHAPSASECASCHVDAAGYVLGLNTAQLNSDVDGENQILNWSKRGLVDLPDDFDPEKVARYDSPFGDAGTVASRARTYLDVNCAMCHQPNGPGNANIDLRYATDLQETKMIDEAPAQGDLGIKDARIVAPGSPAKSLLLHRIQTLGAGRMPNIGSNAIDDEAVALLKEWIESME